MKRLISIAAIILVVGGLVMFFSLNNDKQLSKKEEMIAIATSDEARKVYDEYLVSIDKFAFTQKGKIVSYDINLGNLEYNPMGGLMVELIINGDEDLNIQVGIVENSIGELEVFGATSSAEFGELVD